MATSNIIFSLDPLLSLAGIQCTCVTRYCHLHDLI